MFEKYQQCRFKTNSLAASHRCSTCGNPAAWMRRIHQWRAYCEECKEQAEMPVLTKAQKEVYTVIKTGRLKYAEVGPGGVPGQTAASLVRKGLCEYDTITAGYPDGKTVTIIRLKERQ